MNIVRWVRLFGDEHRGGIRTAVTNRGEFYFVLCRCGWRSFLYWNEDHCWWDHAAHADRQSIGKVPR